MSISKPRVIAVASALMSSVTFGADAPVPPELASARARYEAALAAAAKPVKDRYIGDLQRLKDRAMSMKNLELAVAIDQELKTIGAPQKAETPSTESTARFEQRLIGTKWTWNGTFHVEFQAEGKSAGKGLTWKTVKPYTIEYSFPDGNHGTILFERALDKAAIKEITNTGTKNPMTLYRIKE